MTGPGHFSGPAAPVVADSAAPGSGKTTSAAHCSDATPCMVCRLRGLAKARTGSDPFVPRPFVVNLLGLRRHLAATDEFDDRLAVCMALPGEESRKALLDLGIEAALVDDINAVVGKLGEPGARRVACDRIEDAEGKPITGHWIMALLPVTTDPGMVRQYRHRSADLAKHDASIAAIDAQLARYDALSKKLDAAKAAMKAKGDVVKGKPLPKRPGDPIPEDRKRAEEALMQAQAEVDKVVAELGLKATPTQAALKSLIQGRNKERARLQKQRDEAAEDVEKQSQWKSGDALAGSKWEGEQKQYMAKTGFRNENGDIEADDHAYFPVGLHRQAYRLFMHHGSSDNAMAALSIGMLSGQRVVSGWLLKKPRVAKDIWDDESAWRVGLASPGVRARLKEHDAEAARRRKEHKAAFPPAKKGAQPDVARLAREKEALTQLEADLAARRIAIERPLYDARADYLEVIGQRRAVQRVPAGTWVMPRCVAQRPDGSMAGIADSDQFLVHEAPGRIVSGREIRLHLGDLSPKTQSVTVYEHVGVEGEAALPDGTEIRAEGMVYDQGGKTWEIADDDIDIVRAPIGGTNIHRGHHFSRASAATGVATAKDCVGRIGNWSTGCQVVPRFEDYNLFILLCGLSKRVACMGRHSAATCARLETGSVTAPDSFVEQHARLDLGSFLDFADVRKKLGELKKQLGVDHAAAAKTLDDETRAWFKARKGPKPPKDTELAHDRRVQTLESALLAAQAAEAALQPKPGDKAAKDPVKLAAAMAEREGAEADLGRFTSARAARDAIVQHAQALDEVTKTLEAGGSPTFHEAALRCAELKQAVQAHGQDARIPAGASAQLEIAKAMAVLEAAPAGLHKECYTRAVVMRHDWMRRCDLAHTHDIAKIPACAEQAAPTPCQKCGQRFDYALVELDAANTTPEFDSIGEVEAEFTRKASDGREAHPRWPGFGA